MHTHTYIFIHMYILYIGKHFVGSAKHNLIIIFFCVFFMPYSPDFPNISISKYNMYLSNLFSNSYSPSSIMDAFKWIDSSLLNSMIHFNNQTGSISNYNYLFGGIKITKLGNIFYQLLLIIISFPLLINIFYQLLLSIISFPLLITISFPLLI